MSQSTNQLIAKLNAIEQQIQADTLSMFGQDPNLIAKQQQYQMLRAAQLAAMKSGYQCDDLPSVSQFGELIGWRAWRFKNGKLLSTYQNTEWIPHLPLESHEKPGSNDSGIYAHKRIEDLIRQEGDREWDVMGECFLWGEVIEHQYGYRAEFARPKKFHMFASNMTESFKVWLDQEFCK